MSCKFKFLYYTDVDSSNYISPHKHKCYELVYYINGYGFTNIEGTTLRYVPNSFSLMLPEHIHDQRHNEVTSVIYIGFSTDNPPKLLNSGLFYDNSQMAILSIMNDMKNELLYKNIHYEVKLDLLLNFLFIELERMENIPQKKCADFSYIINFIKENCGQKIDFNTLSELAGYSYHRFRVLFKQKTGFSPVNFLMNQRIEKSKYLLKNTSISISMLAQECGFYDHSQFCSMFHKIVGVTPGNYRKNNKF